LRRISGRITNMNEARETAAEYFKRSVKHQLKCYEKLIERLPFRDTDHVFELGCGTAEMSSRLATEIVPNGQVTACDPEESRVRFAMDKFSNIPNLRFIHATGSAALENKADLYDVIVSNAVLHWIEGGELEKTMVNMFNALKSGGIAAHNFNVGIPEAYRLLSSLEEGKLNEYLKIRYVMEEEKFASLCREVGFSILDAGKSEHATECETEEELLKLLDATSYGLFGWEKLFNDAKDKRLTVKFSQSDDGKVQHVATVATFILKKPT